MAATMDVDPPAGPSLQHLLTLQSLVSSLASLSSELAAARLAHEASPSSSEPFDARPFLDAAAPFFAMLKAVNRTGSSTVVECKQQAAEARSELDTAHLGLQNLVYERRHLEKEIRNCREFETEYQTISLHSPEEFAELMEQRAEAVPSDPHDLMLARLRLELAERKRFEAEKKDLLQRKLKLSKENDEKKNKLDELERQLDSFVSTARDIQTNMRTQQAASS